LGGVVVVGSYEVTSTLMEAKAMVQVFENILYQLCGRVRKGYDECVVAEYFGVQVVDGERRSKHGQITDGTDRGMTAAVLKAFQWSMEIFLESIHGIYMIISVMAARRSLIEDPTYEQNPVNRPTAARSRSKHSHQSIMH
jgi:hypothetical protein